MDGFGCGRNKSETDAILSVNLTKQLREVRSPVLNHGGRKRVLGIMAAILAARKLAQYDGGKRVPATVSAIADSVRWAEEIMRAIDERWPSK